MNCLVCLRLRKQEYAQDRYLGERERWIHNERDPGIFLAFIWNMDTTIDSTFERTKDI